ncbi:MAG: hypothetical protein F4099_01500 [Synechococcus sp. SB0673_bin_10]|nr:hypothetical protein [Synechococcus sp. SB0668_bin_13]MXY18408.1 hypothetical protein [Synechococcus sp. SB0664_bin_36]MYG64448.1 hypothetical protein [Synechococcus sp. SB0675_bin_7]MYI71199.1 hypothetical protein [Synechococcus sp. SB0673_bin_10]
MPSGPYGLIIRQRRQRGAAFFKFLERVMPDQASASGHPNCLTAQPASLEIPAMAPASLARRGSQSPR